MVRHTQLMESNMTSKLELKSTEEMTTEDWEELLNQHNTYSWYVYLIYSIVWLPLLIMWIIIEYRTK